MMPGGRIIRRYVLILFFGMVSSSLMCEVCVLNLNALQNQNKLHKLLILLGEYTEKINNIKK